MEYVTFHDALSVNEGKNRKMWYVPKAIDKYRDALKINDNIIKSNIAYSMQYLEYVQLQIDKLWFPESVERLLRKTYIVSATSIIEAFFADLLASTHNDSKKTRDSFNLAIDKVVEKNLLNFNAGQLKELKNIRNRVHLQVAKTWYDNDYHSFDNHAYRKMRVVFFDIITSDKFTCDKNAFALFEPPIEFVTSTQ